MDLFNPDFALTILDEIRSGKRQVDLLEVMVCPGGCANGGGQPLPVDEQVIRTRSRAIYEMDNSGSVQEAHHNPAIGQVYHEFLKEPGSPASKEHLYTTFSKREVNSGSSSPGS